MTLKFEKYHGAGNDFIILNESNLVDIEMEKYSELARKICHRHYGIGSDGLIILKYIENIPYMLFFNPDGSQAPMCGNGIRTFGHYLKNNKFEMEKNFIVKTKVGNLKLEIIDKDLGFFVKVNMGKPIFNVKNLINIEKDEFLKEKIILDNEKVEISYIFMGTDHSVIFVKDFNEYNIEKIGSMIENYTEIFPKRVNVNFVKICDKNNIEVITWERGAGKTLACGTGITASVVLARKFGYVNEKVNVKALGGQLVVEYDKIGEEAYMIGPSVKIAEGYYHYV